VECTTCVLSLVVDWLKLDGVPCWVCRVGYAGEASRSRRSILDCVLRLQEYLRRRGEGPDDHADDFDNGNRIAAPRLERDLHMKISPFGNRAKPRCGASMTRYEGTKSQVWLGLAGIVRVAAHELQMTLGLRSYVHGASISLCMSAEGRPELRGPEKR
jgi:hypothetical protein